MADVEPITIKGLTEFSRNLRKLDNELPKALRLAANEAGEIVVKYARPKVASGPAKGGHASSSIKAKSTRTSARVSAGGNRYPYYAWLDFGGRVGRGKRTVRPFLRTGRYMFKGYTENRDEVRTKLLEALIGVARSAGVEVS